MLLERKRTQRLCMSDVLQSTPVTLCHTSLDAPVESTSHISDPPIFSRPSTNSLLIIREGFCPGFLLGCLLSGRFSPGWFLIIPLSVRIHLLQQKVKHRFTFHVSKV